MTSPQRPTTHRYIARSNNLRQILCLPISCSPRKPVSLINEILRPRNESMSAYMSDGKYFRRHRKKRVTTLEHTSFASPLDSILFRDSTHSSHFAQPLGSTAGLLFLPSHPTVPDSDVPTSAVLASLFSTSVSSRFACSSRSLSLTSSSCSPWFLSRSS